MVVQQLYRDSRTTVRVYVPPSGRHRCELCVWLETPWARAEKIVSEWACYETRDAVATYYRRQGVGFWVRRAATASIFETRLYCQAEIPARRGLRAHLAHQIAAVQFLLQDFSASDRAYFLSAMSDMDDHCTFLSQQAYAD